MSSNKLHGRLDDLLLFAVRLKRNTWNDIKKTLNPEFYVAPLHEVGADVLAKANANPYLSPAQPGFRAPGAQVCVLFELAGPRGDVNGEQRACAVCLAQQQDHNMPDEAQAVTLKRSANHVMLRPHASYWKLRRISRPYTLPVHAVGSRVRVMQKWQTLCSPEQHHAAVNAQESELEQALKESSDERLCIVLLNAVGGLSPPEELACITPGGCSSTPKRDFDETDLQLRDNVQVELHRLRENRLLVVVITCLTHLNLSIP